MSAGVPRITSVLRGFVGANVKFVAVGDLETPPLRLVVSRHPTNLDALGRVLDALGAVVRVAPPESAAVDVPAVDVSVDDAAAVDDAADVSAEGKDRSAGLYRAGDPLGTMALTTPAGDVELLFGSARRSLYAEVVATARDREIGGVVVQWVGELPDVEPPPRATSRMLGRRLLSLAEGLAHLIERRGGHVEGDDGDSAEERNGSNGSGAAT